MIERAWVRFTPGASPTILAGKRISTVARTTGGVAGDYTVTLTDDLCNTDGCVTGAYGAASIAAGNRFEVKATVSAVNQLRVVCYDNTGTLADPAELCLFVDTDADSSIGQ